jgi:hypothetical protein
MKVDPKHFIHSICGPCWRKFHRDGLAPVRSPEPERETCCACGCVHQSGIYSLRTSGFKCRKLMLGGVEVNV